ncbi:MAG: SLBB domain-containing protein, partial [Rhodospirillaceae bacterium]|nr:SLBB domain-containing protein [Rhodospirillaceae bacterium]
KSSLMKTPQGVPGALMSDNTKLRAGDVVQIVLPGETSFAKPLQLDANGNVTIPEIGVVALDGLTLAAGRDRLRDRLEVVFRDLERLDLLLEDRRLLVRVLGYVKKPGIVNLDGNANVQTAIIAAGGLRQGAQLDRLQLRRGQANQAFNYKSYLDSGDPNNLPALAPGDVIFVPASPLLGNVEVEFDARTLTAAGDAGEGGEAVRIFGEVQKPGTFAFKKGQSAVDMIMRAGGTTRYAGVEKIRVMNGSETFLFNLKEYLDTGSGDLIPEIKPGATIFIPIRVDEVKAGSRTVYVMGEVANPGAFEMTEGANFFDVLANSGGPNRYAETRQLRIIRADGNVVPFDLAGYTEGRQVMGVPAIYSGDAIFVPVKTDQLEKSWLKISPERAIKIMGQVRKPGRYEWSDEMSLLDLLAHAGGATRKADTSKLQVLRVQDGKAIPEVFNLAKFLEQGGVLADLPVLSAGDSVVIPELPIDPAGNKSVWVRQSSDRSIYMMGAVNSPGRYAFREGLSFLDILSAADGPRTSADLKNIRVSHRTQRGSRISKLDLALYFETGDDKLLPIVAPGDVIYVPARDREWTEVKSEQTIRVLGAVGKPGRYNFDNSMTVLDLLAEAGGPTNAAWQEKIVVVNMVEGKQHAQSFNLVDFAKSGDFGRLPVIRAGDTVYVPSKDQSDWSLFMASVKDAVQVLSVVLLIAGI